MPEPTWYESTLYPLQDRVLAAIAPVQGPLYLTGGTALARGYLNHRFSDDLDLFANDDADFRLLSARIIHALGQNADWQLHVLVNDERFSRLTVTETGVVLQVELVNDVPCHLGQIAMHPVLGRLDDAKNILANKVTAALDRDEPKDLADIWALCTVLGLDLSAAIEDATGKAAGVFPADLARLLCDISEADYAVIRWRDPPGYERFAKDLRALAEKLLLIC